MKKNLLNENEIVKMMKLSGHKPHLIESYLADNIQEMEDEYGDEEEMSVDMAPEDLEGGDFAGDSEDVEELVSALADVLAKHTGVDIDVETVEVGDEMEPEVEMEPEMDPEVELDVEEEPEEDLYEGGDFDLPVQSKGPAGSKTSRKHKKGTRRPQASAKGPLGEVDCEDEKMMESIARKVVSKLMETLKNKKS